MTVKCDGSVYHLDVDVPANRKQILNVGITHVFSCINIFQVLMKLFEYEAIRPSFQTSSKGTGVCFFCLFDLILYAPSTIFQLDRDGSSWVEPVLSSIKCLAQGPQGSDSGGTQTCGPSVSSQALYH